MAPPEREHDQPSPDQAWDQRTRDETPEQRADRNLVEILQELRVLSVGVQVLFGFLLSFPLNSRFGSLHRGERALYTVSLASAALATALLVGPVAYHRLVFQQHEKTRVVRVANLMALAGLIAVGTAITTALWLIVGVVYRGAAGPIFGAAAAAIFVALWLVLPLAARRQGGSARRDLSAR